MKRVFILLLDSFGIGALPDAEQFGDAGSNTLRHIAEKCMAGEADVPDVRSGILDLPNLTRLGLHAAARACNGMPVPGLAEDVGIQGAYGYAAEIGKGKDTSGGHWEIAGVPVLFDWGFFPPQYPSFPEVLLSQLIERGKVPGLLGNKAASGTEILAELGDESVRTGKPIVYTSADSVFQIAAHEKAFGLDRLYELCEIARELVDEYNVARVIARPFIGEMGNYARTGNRRDYSVVPPAPTLLDKLKADGGQVIGIGKIPDIFAHQGISNEIHASGNMNLFDATVVQAEEAGDRSLVFTNFVDFDMKFGHRRNTAAYAHALEEFDARIPEMERLLQPGDLMFITADHGCDPTHVGTDHTREYIPIMLTGPGVRPVSIGRRDTYADIGQTIAEYFDLEKLDYGTSFLQDVL